MKKSLVLAATLLGLGIATLTIGQNQAEAANCNVADSMVQVKNFKSGTKEYVEFKFKKPTAFTVSTTAVTGPFSHLTSDNPVFVAGAKFTRVMFSGLYWTCSIPRIRIVRPIIKDFKSIEQFEGVVGYVIGRRSSSHYLTTQLFAPCTAGYRCVRVLFGP
jgi:hypothetical protein